MEGQTINLTRLGVLREFIAAGANAPRLCIVLDLGDLHRSDRAARMLGAPYADGIARAAASRIRTVTGRATRIARIDADCFAFVIPDEGEHAWRSLVETLIARLRTPVVVAGLPGAATPSVGIVRFRTGSSGAEQILQAAIIAALEARDTKPPWRLHSKAADGAGGRLRSVLSGFAAALSAPDQLSLVYQPRIDLRGGDCLSVEALLRWQHPVLGPVPPDEFIPLAERTGMMRRITAWVIHRALTDLAAWTAAGFAHGVSINVSALDLVEDDFVRNLAHDLGRHGLGPSKVELEVTEGALVHGSARSAVADLAALGFGISIDDFGTGYSNLHYLRDIPATALKIDRSFVRSLATSRRDPIIVRSMIELAHALGYRVVAEGIEDGEVFAMLAGWECDEGQGNHISRPVPAAELHRWVAARSRLTAAAW